MTIVNLAEEAPEAVAYGAAGYDAFADLWARLVRPFDVVHTVAVITGLSPKAVTQAVGLAIATSAEAERLLDDMPRTIRSLATSMETHHERCKGELRGPVLWSETMSARASTFGDDDLYVCMTPSRVYDVEENRILVAALVAVRDAAATITDEAARADGDLEKVLRVARRNGADAGRFAEHPSLARVARVQPNGRGLKRTRAGKKRKVYEPAIDLLGRAANPLSPADVRRWCDRRTRAQLGVLMALVHRLEAAGVDIPDLRQDRGRLVAGPLAYRHARVLGDHRSTAGILAPGLLIDVPDDLSDRSRRRAATRMEARAGARQVIVVTGDHDLDTAAEQVLHRLAD